MKKAIAIETSCDDTSISILDGIEIISLKTFSQIAEHAKFGGVIPEMASRLHSKYIYKIIDLAMKDANVTFDDIKEIYVTKGPGLVNTLQVGITVAKTLSLTLGIPLYGVNHIEAHAYSPFIGIESKKIPSKAIVLIASGGHTQILLKDKWKMELLGETKDDSIGEAYDKVAKAFGKSYPGGPIIDAIASKYNDIELPIKAPISRLEGYSFSYSGLKSFMINKSKERDVSKDELLAAFQTSAIQQIYLKIEKAVNEFQINKIIVGGGVSANSLLRHKLKSNKDWEVYLPKLMYTGDNAAMIGYLGVIKKNDKKLLKASLKLDANPRRKCMTKILNGTKLAKKITTQLKEEINLLEKKPHLVALQVGDNAESEIYIEHKSKKANEIGMIFTHLKFPYGTTEESLINSINELNMNPDVDGIMVQMPLPKNINPSMISQVIAPWKDVDGFHPLNKGLLDMDQAELISPTALGVYELLKEANIELKGKKVAIIGTGDITGKPTAKIMINNGATVSICNINTKDISEFTKDADIIISAAGQKHIITNDIIKDGAIVVNVGITKDIDKTYGDVDFDNINKASWITPIIGGTGPMTVALLLKNTLICYKMKNK